jgi:hypothetical protein
MTDDELRAIEARVEAATPGEWVTLERGGSYFGWDVEPVPSGLRGQFEHEADAAFIAHARQDVSALLATIAALRAENAALRGEVERMKTEGVIPLPKPDGHALTTYSCRWCGAKHVSQADRYQHEQGCLFAPFVPGEAAP